MNKALQDKIAHFFRLLRDRKIDALQNLACCQSCGIVEIARRHQERTASSVGETKIGYCFYHQQDADYLQSAPESEAGTHLAFGVWPDSEGDEEENVIALGNKIVACATVADLDTEWNGTMRERIWVKNKVVG